MGPGVAEAQVNLPPLDKLLKPPAPAPPVAPPAVNPPGAPAPPKPGAKTGAAQAAPPAPVPPPPSPCGPAPSPPKIKRQRGGNTFRLAELIRPLVERGMEPRQAMVLAAPPFPVAGPATYSDDWLNARMTPCPHLHKGTDIFADFGTPVVASGPGDLVAMGRGPVGGLAVWVSGDDGNSFYYAHLQS
jgi:murein DD-endopeptidase MepM/ murein hydrolase activator NlpD